MKYTYIKSEKKYLSLKYTYIMWEKKYSSLKYHLYYIREEIFKFEIHLLSQISEWCSTLWLQVETVPTPLVVKQRIFFWFIKTSKIILLRNFVKFLVIIKRQFVFENGLKTKIRPTKTFFIRVWVKLYFNTKF